MKRLGLLILLWLMCAACADVPERPPVVVAPGAPVRVGLVTALTGDLAGEVQVIRQAAALAVSQFGDLNDHPVELVVSDGGCDVTATEAAVTGLMAQDGMLGIVGPLCSAACVRAVNVVEHPRMVLVTPRCTSIVVTRQGYGGVFRTAWSDGVEANAAAYYTREYLKKERVFFVNDGTIYGRSMRDVFSLFFGGKPRTIADKEVTDGSGDYTKIAQQIARSSADIVYFGGFAADAARFLTQLRAAGVTLPVFGSQTMFNDAFLAAAGTAAEGICVTDAQTSRRTGRAYWAFHAAYEARFGTAPGPLAAEAFDAVNVILRTAEREDDGKKGKLELKREEMIKGMYATNLLGASGRVRFLPNGDRTEGVVVRLMCVQNGRFVERIELRRV